MAAWLPVPLAIILFDQKLLWKSRILKMGVGVTSVIVGPGTLVAMGLWKTSVGVGLASAPVALYHAAVAFVANYTWVSVAVVAGFAITWLSRREWMKLGLMAGVGIIDVISLLPWHSGPYGRLGLFLVYPLAWLYSRLPKWIGVLAIILILPSWFVIAKAYQGTPLPQLQQKLIAESGCRGRQLILSEIQRPQLLPIYPSAWYVGPANWQDVSGEIATAVQAGKSVCISQQARDYPYRQYEGQLPYPLSGKSGSQGFLAEELKGNKVKVAAADPAHPELTIYVVSR